MLDLYLTPHFHLSEFTRSATADRLGIDNTPSSDDVIHIMALCAYTLEPLRVWWAQPIHINSGFRCRALNKAVGGVSSSQHLIGEAADIRVKDQEEACRMVEVLKKYCTFDQAIIEHDKNGNVWLHVSCKWDKTHNRKNVIYNMLKE